MFEIKGTQNKVLSKILIKIAHFSGYTENEDQHPNKRFIIITFLNRTPHKKTNLCSLIILSVSNVLFWSYFAIF